MLAGKSYEAPDGKLPGGLKDLDYDQYRSIRFLPERALWRGKYLPFEAQFFHRGFFYKNRVNIFEVADGKAAELKYLKADFTFGDKVPACGCRCHYRASRRPGRCEGSSDRSSAQDRTEIVSRRSN